MGSVHGAIQWRASSDPFKARKRKPTINSNCHQPISSLVQVHVARRPSALLGAASKDHMDPRHPILRQCYLHLSLTRRSATVDTVKQNTEIMVATRLVLKARSVWKSAAAARNMWPSRAVPIHADD